MKKKAKVKVKGKAKTSPKRSAVKDLSAKKAGSVKGGLPAVQLQGRGHKVSTGSLLPAVQKVADGSV